MATEVECVTEMMMIVDLDQQGVDQVVQCHQENVDQWITTTMEDR